MKALFIVLAIFLTTGAAACSPSSGGDASEEQAQHKDAPHDDNEESHDRVQFSPAALKRSDIRLAPVGAGRIEGALTIPAEVEFDPDRVAHIGTFVEGQVAEIKAGVGDTVKAGQKLASIKSSELGEMRAALKRAETSLELAKTTFERRKRLQAAGIASESSLLEAQAAFEEARASRDAAKSRLQVLGNPRGAGATLAVRSPIDGTVHQRKATRGEGVAPGDDLFIVADLARVWVVGRASEKQVGRLSPGMGATLTLAAYSDRHWTGEVDYISAALDPNSRTLEVRVELDNPDGALRPGLFGTLRLDTAAQAPDTDANAKAPAAGGPVVPRSAVQELNGRPVVFIAGEKPGEFVATPVTLGQEYAGQVAVLAGLEPGQSVVVQGAFILKSELVRQELGSGHAH